MDNTLIDRAREFMTQHGYPPETDTPGMLDALQLIAAFHLQESNKEWTATKDKLPEEGCYLTTRKTRDGFEVAELRLWFDDDGFKHWAAMGDGYPDDFQGVIAWKPMPDPFTPHGESTPEKID